MSQSSGKALPGSGTAETTPQKHSQNQHQPSKPILILISPSSANTIDLITRYSSIISKLERDAHVIFANGLTQLRCVLANESMAESIGGFIVTDARVMGVDGGNGDGDEDGDGEARAISGLLTEIVKGTYSFHHEEASTISGPDQPTSSKYLHRTIISHEWTVLFAFDFPAQAALQPLRFKNYISDNFGAELGWKICGATKNEWTLKIKGVGLRNMSGGVYHGNRYRMRAVFLDGVEDSDKILVAGKGKASAEPGDADGRLRGLDTDPLGDSQLSGPGYETDSTTAEEDFDFQKGQAADAELGSIIAKNNNTIPSHFPPIPACGLRMADLCSRDECRKWVNDRLAAESEFFRHARNDCSGAAYGYTGSDGDGDDEEQTDRWIIYTNVPEVCGQRSDSVQDDDDHYDSDPDAEQVLEVEDEVEGSVGVAVADCPVALHEIKSWIEAGGQRVCVRGYVGFVGHVEDNRSMASLILGMCGVQKARPSLKRAGEN
ncbi:hypothetical protein BDW69DRAFT_188860 [Aspergillus filifer]